MNCYSWHGPFTTGSKAPAVVKRLGQEVRKIIVKPEVQAQFAAQGLEPSSSDRKSKAPIDRELTRWGEDAKAMGTTVGLRGSAAAGVDFYSTTVRSPQSGNISRVSTRESGCSP